MALQVGEVIEGFFHMHLRNKAFLCFQDFKKSKVAINANIRIMRAFILNNSKTHKLYADSYKNYLQTSLYL